MDTKKIEFSKLDHKLHCPYCNEIIFAIGDEDIQGSCDHLLFIYDDYSDRFIKTIESIKNAFEQAHASADEIDGLSFDNFVEQLTFNDATDSIGIYIGDERSDCAGGIWIGFKSL